MKWLAVIGALLFAPLVTAAPADTPEDTALAFLAELSGTGASVDEVLAGTALSPFCGEQKREWIESRLELLRSQLRADQPELKVIAAKEDGEFAAVLVAVVSPGDPFSAEVLGVALRRGESGWRPAPVLGDFVNTNVGFDAAVRGRAEALERWMGEQRVLRMQELYAAAVEDLEKRMESVVPDELLREGMPDDVVRGFLKACRENDLAAALVFLGAESGWDDHPGSVQTIVSLGLRGEDPVGSWNPLISPDVVSVVAGLRKGRYETVVSVLFYDIESVSGAQLINFSLNRKSDRWQIDLPRVLRETDVNSRPWISPGEKEHRLRRRFSEFFEASYPARRFADPLEMGRCIEETLQSGTLAEFFALLARDESFAEGERLVTYAEAGRVWKEFRERGRDASHGQLIDVLVEGTAATVVLHLVTTAALDRLELVTVLLVKREDGWAIAPGVTGLGNWESMPKRESLDQKEILMRFVRKKGGFEKVAAERFLEGFALVDTSVADDMTEEAAGRLVRKFREFLRAGDLPGAFSCCALLDRSEGAWEALKSLTYEYRGASKAGEPDRELLLQARGPWAGVSLRLDSGPSDVPDYPLYLVRSTAAGPRIVVDGGLRLATNKGREILNEQNWKHLVAELPEDELGLVRTLFEAHRERSKTDYTAWEKSIKSSR